MNFFTVSETICIILFTIEVTLRLWSSPNKKLFFMSIMNIIDIIAVAPFYVTIIIKSQTNAQSNANVTSFIRVLRLARVSRIFKVSRYSSSIKVFIRAMIASVRPLSMLLFLTIITGTVFSSSIYYAEWTADGCRTNGWVRYGTTISDENICLGRQPYLNGTFVLDSGQLHQCKCVLPNPFDSILMSLWWCMVTMTTVG